MSIKTQRDSDSLFNAALYNAHLHTTALSANPKLAHQILSFSALSDGWHFGEGVSATLFTIAMALQLSEKLEEAGAEVIEAFPDINGGILIAGYKGDETIEILISPYNTYSYSFECGDEEQVYETDVSYAEVIKVVGALDWLHDYGSDCAIQNILASTNAALPVWPSKTRQAEGCPLSTWIAPSEPLEQFASISRVFTRHELQANQQSFGDLKKAIA